MPRRPSLRSLLAAIAMAVVALCGGGKAMASERGTASAVEIRSGTATRADTRKRCAEAVAAVAAGITEMRAGIADAARGGLDSDPAIRSASETAFSAFLSRHPLNRVDLKIAQAPRCPRSRAPPA